jgi:hypothetical protein
MDTLERVRRITYGQTVFYIFMMEAVALAEKAGIEARGGSAVIYQ